jgi:hypothetical protein
VRAEPACEKVANAQTTRSSKSDELSCDHQSEETNAMLNCRGLTRSVWLGTLRATKRRDCLFACLRRVLFTKSLSVLYRLEHKVRMACPRVRASEAQQSTINECEIPLTGGPTCPNFLSFSPGFTAKRYELPPLSEDMIGAWR